MIIEIKRKQDKIVLKVCGRLDTSTAPQLEDEITVSAGGIYLVWHFGEEDGAAVRD